MIKTLSGLILPLAFLLPLRAVAQSTQAGDGKTFILIVPYSPPMYKNTADHIICKANDINPGELNNTIRRSISATMVTNLSEHYHTREVKSDNLEDPKSHLSLLYSAIGYKNKRRKLVAYHKGYPPFKLRQFLGSRHSRWGSDCVSGDFKKPFSRHSYVEGFVKNDSIFSQVMADNRSAFVILINQFEMNTRFKSCLDIQRNVFQRDIFIHFTLLDSSGKKLHGGVIGTTFQASTNDLETIMEKNIGLLTGFIIDIVRKEI